MPTIGFQRSKDFLAILCQNKKDETIFKAMNEEKDEKNNKVLNNCSLVSHSLLYV